MTATNSSSGVGAGRYGYLDSLRGIAALLVLMYHALRAFERMHWPSMEWEKIAIAICNDWLNFGKFGVAIFFMVSGFVIPSSLRRDKRYPLLVFAISRVARLYPAYWLSVACAVVAFILVPAPFSSLTILVNLTMLQQFLGFENILDIYWTLQIEIIFYVLCAVLFFYKLLDNAVVIERIAWAFLVIAIGLAALRWSTGSKVPVAIPLALFLMFLGNLYRRARIDTEELSLSRAMRLLIAFIIAIPVISLLAYNRDMGFGEKWYSYTLSYSFAALFATAVIFLVKKRFRTLEWFGTISYSIYLLHYIIILLSVEWFRRVGYVPSGIIIYLVMILAITLILSQIVYTFVELPFIRVGKRAISYFVGVPANAGTERAL